MEDSVTCNDTVEVISSSPTTTQETVPAETDCASESESETASSASEVATATFTRSSLRSSARSSIQKDSALSTDDSSRRTSRYSQSIASDAATARAWLERDSSPSLDRVSTSSPTNPTVVKIISSTWGADSSAIGDAGRSTSSSEERIRNLKLEMERTLDLDFSISSSRESVSSGEQYTQEQTALLLDVVSPGYSRHIHDESVLSAEDPNGSHTTGFSDDDDTSQAEGLIKKTASHTSAMNSKSNCRSPVVESDQIAGSARSSDFTGSVRTSKVTRVDPLVTSHRNSDHDSILTTSSIVSTTSNTISTMSSDTNILSAVDRCEALMAKITAELKTLTASYADTAIKSAEDFNASQGLPLTHPTTVDSNNDAARTTSLTSSSFPDPYHRRCDQTLMSHFDDDSSSDSGDGQSIIETPGSLRTSTSIWRQSMRGFARDTFRRLRISKRTTSYISGPLHVVTTAPTSVDNLYSTASEAIAAHLTARPSRTSSFFAQSAGPDQGYTSRSGSSLSSSEYDTDWSKVGSTLQSKFSRFGKKTGTYFDKAISRSGASVTYRAVDRALDTATDTIFSIVSKSGTSIAYDSTAGSVKDVGEMRTTGPRRMRNWRTRR